MSVPYPGNRVVEEVYVKYDTRPEVKGTSVIKVHHFVGYLLQLRPAYTSSRILAAVLWLPCCYNATYERRLGMQKSI
jgi:hypothetical protein